jgi:hypothetical protein
MIFGNLFPATLAVWKPRRAIASADARIGRLLVAYPRITRADAGALPHGMIAVAPETQSALAATVDFARGRCVDLQMAVEPGLTAQADAAEYRACLRQLILGAIGRASTGVLVTAMRRGDSVEVAVLDDGSAPAGAGTSSPPQPEAEQAIPLGATLTTDYRPEHGTTVLLRLPQPDLPPPA